MNTSFSMRYIVDEAYYYQQSTLDKARPILFYCGNEGDIWSFYDNSGFINTIAEQMGGLVVFAEHRYFGQSFPFDKADAFNSTNNKYLTVE